MISLEAAGNIVQNLTVFSITDWLKIIVFGGLLGMCGQALRVIAGLKKASDEADASKTKLADNFDTGRFFRSMLIGAVAGVVSAFTLVVSMDPVSRDVVMAVIAAGYAGTDFIEAFMRKSMPTLGLQPEVVKSVQSNTVVDAAAADASVG